MENILYYGSFNPITKAHVDIIQCLKILYNNTNVILKITPKKFYDKDFLMEDKHRLNMLKECLENNISVDLQKDAKHLTFYEAACKLMCNYVVLGADNILTLIKYYKPVSGNSIYDLLNEKYIIIFDRKDLAQKLINENDFLLKYRNKITLIPFNNAYSSSLFRETKDYDILPSKVANYIKNNKLYEN